eukprot:COSAG01_NODE_6430_length_3670_cov_4.546346_2_plen_526_part_00
MAAVLACLVTFVLWKTALDPSPSTPVAAAADMMAQAKPAATGAQPAALSATASSVSALRKLPLPDLLQRAFKAGISKDVMFDIHGGMHGDVDKIKTAVIGMLLIKGLPPSSARTPTGSVVPTPTPAGAPSSSPVAAVAAAPPLPPSPPVALPKTRRCMSGQIRGLHDEITKSSTNTRVECAKECAMTPSCLSFDVATRRGRHPYACRLSTAGLSEARRGGGSDNREVCELTGPGQRIAPPPAAPSPPPLAHTSATSGLQLGDTALSAAKAIHQKHNIVLMMILNAGYVSQGKSWVCNVKKFAGVLDKTLILATDMVAFNAFKEFDAGLHIFHEGFGSPAEMKYGQVGYWKLMRWRSRLLQKLIDDGVHVLVAEADQIWFVDVIKDVQAQAQDNAFMCLNDLATGGRMVNGGFQYIAPAMSSVWKEYVAKYDQLLAKHEHKTSSADIGDTSDQIMLNTIMHKAKVKWKFLDPLKYVSGKYYIDQTYASKVTKPSLIHNNWVVGNGAKESRAKKRGQWYMDGNGKCK